MSEKPRPGSAAVSAARLTWSDGWRSRGYLPHFEQPGLVQMVTFRLADSLPSERADELRLILRRQNGVDHRRAVEAFLDAGHGVCYLRDQRLARLVESALVHFDGARYHLLAWVVIPNHVHVLIEGKPAFQLSTIVHSWKSFTAKEANKLLKRAGTFWQPEYIDRTIRDERHLASAIWYVHANPVKAGLAARAEDWPFSSASRFVGETKAAETAALPGSSH